MIFCENRKNEYELKNSNKCLKCPICEEPDTTKDGMTCKKKKDYFSCLTGLCDTKIQMIMPDNNCLNCPICEYPDPMAVPSFTKCM